MRELQFKSAKMNAPKRPKRPRRRFHYPRRSDTMHASQSLAQVAANFYFSLARGNKGQREAAEEWRALFMEIPRLLNQ